MGLLKLRFSMLGTVALIIGLSTLFFTILLTWAGAFGGAFGVWYLVGFVVGINLLQWLIAPYLLGAMYGIRELPQSDYPRLHAVVRNICQRAGLAVPKLMLAQMNVPNAFAYGSPLTGNRVALTTGLLKSLEEEEVEAVIGHELGHLKHRDVQIMMFVSVLPAVLYYIGFSLMASAWYGGRDRNNGGGAVAVGLAAMALYWVLTLFVLGLSRLREYYADQFAVRFVEDGARKMAEGLAKIVSSTGRLKARSQTAVGNTAFRALFISDPNHATDDVALIARSGFLTTDSQLVQQVLTQRVTRADRFLEVLSTHPNIVKRLRALKAPVP